MILLDSSDSLQVLLAGTVATVQPVLYAAFADHVPGSFTPGSSSGTTNGATAVDWVAAPADIAMRQVKYLSLYNADTAAVDATIRVVDNATNRILLNVSIGEGERLEYVDGKGFRVIDSTGAEKVSSSVTPSVGTKQVQVMLSDMSTALTTGTGKALWIAPEDGSLTDVWIGVGTVSSSGAVTVDFNKNGTSVLTTQPSIDASEATSLTGTAAVIGTAAFVKGDRFTFDLDAAGTGAKALMATVEYEPS